MLYVRVFGLNCAIVASITHILSCFHPRQRPQVAEWRDKTAALMVILTELAEAHGMGEASSAGTGRWPEVSDLWRAWWAVDDERTPERDYRGRSQ